MYAEQTSKSQSNACTSIGPQRLERDNTAYNDALGETWKRQMLLNMVKLRYGDAPVFLNVASLINQYSLEGQISVNSPGWDQPNNVGPPIAGAAGLWADRPTITYTPVSGEHFTRSLLTPIQPMSLLSMVQSGWPVEFVFGIAVRAINGVANGTRSILLRQEPDPRFGELLQALDQVQRLFRALRPAIVVVLVIPVVLLMTIFSAWLMGYTIDRVSLFALIFSIGILVDDATVVVDEEDTTKKNDSTEVSPSKKARVDGSSSTFPDEPQTKANAVIRIGRVRVLHAVITASTTESPC
mgnify:CR=1 FL=1